MADGRHLVLRQQVGEDLVHARLGGDALGHAPVVAGQHDDPADTGGLQFAHHRRRVGAQLVGQGDDAQKTHVQPAGGLGHDDARLALVFQRGHGGADLLGQTVAFVAAEVARVANVEFDAPQGRIIDHAAHPLPGDGLEVVDGRQRLVARRGLGNDGCGQGVLRPGLDSRGQTQQIVGGVQR